MKKFLLVIMLVLGVFSLAACNEPKDDKLTNSISYLVESSFIGENDEFTVIIDGGNKEEVFVDDGKVGNIVPFTKLTIIPKAKLDSNEIEVSLVSGNNVKKLNLQKDMFTNNFELNIKERLTADKVKIFDKEIGLKDIVKDCINKDALLKIIKSELTKQINEGYKDNKFNKELYIKLVRDNNKIDGELYWYVALIDGKNSFCSLLVDAKTGKVLTKKLTA